MYSVVVCLFLCLELRDQIAELIKAVEQLSPKDGSYFFLYIFQYEFVKQYSTVEHFGGCYVMHEKSECLDTVIH